MSKLSDQELSSLLELLELRFREHMVRHEGLGWNRVLERLLQRREMCWVINQMEQTGGEPDVVSFDEKTGEYIFYDCALESPKERRSLCYDRGAWESRKEHKPQTSALEMAESLGIELLTEEEYRYLQTLGEFDVKTSSWVKTPDRIRSRGGALFCDRRYDHVFTYHNGAESYYAARGFRGVLRI